MNITIAIRIANRKDKIIRFLLMRFLKGRLKRANILPHRTTRLTALDNVIFIQGLVVFVMLPGIISANFFVF